MRELLGLIALNAALAAPGMALLVALRLVRPRPVAMALALGPALLLGVATAIPLLIAVLAAGFTVRLPAALVLIALLTAAFAGLAVLRERRGAGPYEQSPPWTALERWVAGLVAAGFAAYFALGASAFSRTAPIQDGLHIWAFKSLGLFHYGEITPEVFESDSMKQIHHDYPLLQPVLHSLAYRFGGEADLGFGQVENWILLAAFAWTVAFLLALGRSWAMALPPVAALVASDALVAPLSLGYADVTVALFVAAGALGVGLWLERSSGRYLVVGALFLGAAANAKNEGVPFALAILAAAALVVARDRRDLLRPLAGAGALLVVSIAPWRLWLGANDIHSTDFPALSTSLDPGYLGDRTERLTTAREHLTTLLADMDYWAFLPSGLIVVCAVALAAGVLRRVAAFYVLAALLSFAGLLWAYWVSKLEIEFHLGTSALRTIMSLAFIAAVALAQLLPALLDRREPGGGEPAVAESRGP